MTTGSQTPENELRRIVRMLDRTAKMIQHATLTGSMAGGREYAIRSYNGILRHLCGLGAVPESLFSALPEDASLDDVAIASAQLSEYLRAGLSEPPEKIAGDGNVMINLGNLGEFAEMVRENLPEWMRARVRERERRAANADPGRPPHVWPPHPPSDAPPHSGGIDDLRPGAPGEAPPAPEPPVDRRREILEELRAGRITPDEAIAKLKDT